MSDSLLVHEIYLSIQGESTFAGLPCAFVRLTGCDLRCSYCDTAYAFDGGKLLPLEGICAEVEKYGSRLVTVTGGEPLAQPNSKVLMTMLCDNGYQVSLETSGAMPIEEVDERVSIVLDLKTPGSHECDRNCYENLGHRKTKDQIKFVICDRADYEWSKAKLDQLNLRNKVSEILFSPSYDQLAASELAEWVLNDALDVRVQLQLHKIIWGIEPGH